MGRDLNKLGLQTEALSNVYTEAGEFKLTRSALIKMFARNKELKILYTPDDYIVITDKESKFVKEVQTTLGIFITNKFLLEDLGIFGYANVVFNGDVINDILRYVGENLLTKDISDEQVDNFLDKALWLWGGPLSHFINPTVDRAMMKLPKNSKALRDSLFSEHGAELNKGNAIVAAQIEDVVIKSAKEELRKTSKSMAIFDSGSGVDFANNYKTVFIMKGPVPDNTEDSGRDFNVVTSNYDEGLKLKDFAANADSMVMGTYAKGKLTGVSGYYTKKYNAMFNRIELLDKGSDCGTAKYMEVTITPENASRWGKWHYFMDNGKPKLLTPSTVKDYMGKTLKMRTPMICEAKDPHYCNICYGDMPYMMKQTRVGTVFALIPNTRMNANLKKFHDMRVKLFRVTMDALMRFVPGYKGGA